MSTDFERELRAGMEQAPIRPRPDVVRVAFRRSRARQRATRAALAAGTAIVAGIAALVLTSVSSGPEVETTAYVVTKMTSALTAANNNIMVYRTDTADLATHRTNSMTIWSYGNRSVTQGRYVGNGQAYLSGLAYVRTSKGTELASVTVDYAQREVLEIVPFTPMPSAVPAWTRSAKATCAIVQSGGLGWVTPSGAETSSQVASVMRGLLTCGKISITWHQRLAGTKAIKMVINVGGASSARMSSTLWVSESTFLPIEGIFTSVTAGRERSITAQYAWLPPTNANLALLDVPIPAGFKIVQLPEFGSASADPAPSATPASSRG